MPQSEAKKAWSRYPTYDSNEFVQCLYAFNFWNIIPFSKFLQKPIFALGGNEEEGRKVAKRRENLFCFDFAVVIVCTVKSWMLHW